MLNLHVFTIFTTPEAFFDGQFRYLEEHGYETLLACGPDEKAKGFAARNHIRYAPVAIPRSMNPFAILYAICRLCALIRREKPKAVFGHTPVATLCAMIAARICGVKHRIYYRHGLIYTTMTGLKRRIFRLEERFVSWLATDVINVSPSLSALAITDRLNPDEKQHVIGDGTCGGIDAIGLFNPAKLDRWRLGAIRLGLGITHHTSITFGFCGRLVRDKGIFELVYGFRQFCARHPELNPRLVLIGRYDTRDGLDHRTQDAIYNDSRIVLTGEMPKEDLPYYYASLDCFVFPSHREGFGMCVIEAGAMEVPVLCSRAHGAIDAIREHVSGEYLRDLSPEAVCEGMELMLDAQLRHRLERQGREWVLQHFDHTVLWPKVDELYQRVLA